MSQKYRSILSFLDALVRQKSLLTSLEIHIKSQNVQQGDFLGFSRFKKKMNRMLKEVNNAGLRKKILCWQIEKISRETELRKEIIADILAYY